MNTRPTDDDLAQWKQVAVHLAAQPEGEGGFGIAQKYNARIYALIAEVEALRAENAGLVQEVKEERGAALDQIEQVRIRDARIEKVRALAYESDDGSDCAHNGHGIQEGEPECPGCWAEGIRRALDGGEEGV